MYTGPQNVLAKILANLLNCAIKDLQQMGGGDTNECYLAVTEKAQYFVKVNRLAFAEGILSSEKKGLELIAQSPLVKTPKVIGFFVAPEFALLVLEYIPSGVKNKAFWKSLAEMLSSLHQQTNDQYGLD